MRLSRLVLAAVALCAPLVAQQEVVETWPDGSVRERFVVDEDGRKDGAYERFRADGSVEVRGPFKHGEKSGTWTAFGADGTKRAVENYRHDQLDGRRETFHADGSLAERTSWRRGVLDGPFEEHSADGERMRTGRYAGGVLHGSLKVTSGRRTISTQVWSEGELVRLDRIDRPFPVGRDALLDSLASILAEPPAPVVDDGDPKAASRAAALRRLQAYRHLCRLPYADMELVAEWNDLCDAASEVCAGNGGLSHDPPQPPGFDDARFQQGRLGASRSNLAGGGMVRSVDSYMDDSDQSNIGRIGHRRWCLNPAMRKTAFGEHEGYSAMWSMDGSGTAPKGLTAVHYPPAGWVPIDMFGPRHAWSISLLRGSQPRKDELVARIRELDEDWIAVGEPLGLDWLDVAGGGYGGSPCIVFRPVGVKVQPGARYLAEVSTDGGKSFDWSYVVAFCAPAGAPR